jgi:hypothetical protein
MSLACQWVIKRRASLFCYFVAIFISIYSWIPLVNAEWSIIDDHEIVDAIGPTGKFSFLDIPSVLSKGELAFSSTSTRFRPAYYTIRYIETAIWGGVPEYWYCFRVMAAIVFAIVLARLCLSIANSVLAAAFVAWMLSAPYWVDIFARLGPAELYATLGLSLIIGSGLRAVGKEWRFWSCASLALGVVLAAGSKENFLFLALIPLWLVCKQWRQLSYINRSVCAAAICFCLWIGATVLIRLSVKGVDIYAHNVSAGSRLILISGFASRQDVKIWLFGIVVLVAVTFWIRRHPEKKRIIDLYDLKKACTREVLILTGLLIVFASQYLFYSGDFGAFRYWLPSELSKQMAVFIATGLAFRVVAVFGVPRICVRALTVVIAFYLFNLSAHGVWNNHSAAVQVALQTKDFTRKFREGVSFLKKNPSAAVVLNSHAVADYEPIISMRLFLNFAGLDRPIAIKINDDSSNRFSPGSLEAILSKGIADMADNVGGGYPYTPLKELDLSKSCYSFGLSGAPASECSAGSRVFN